MPIFILPDEVQQDLTQLLLDISAHIQPFASETEIYGENATLDAKGMIFRMHKYCDCDDMECPWCGGPLTAQSGYSNHEILRLKPIFEATGYVDDEGAPNLWFDNGDVSIKVWWYKNIGRGILVDRQISASDILLLRKAIFEAIADKGVDILQSALRSELSSTGLPGDSSLLKTLQEAFLSLILSAPAAERAARIREVSCAIRDLLAQGEMAHQAHLAGGALDKAGIARSPNPEDPHNLQFEFTLVARLQHFMDSKPR